MEKGALRAPMILAVDVGYGGQGARAAGVLFQNWTCGTVYREIVVEIPEVEKYVPGEFFRRELPCIEKVIACVHHRLDCIVIDGYVNLGDSPTSGLGQHLWERLGRTTPVIGVAKSAYVGTPEAAKLYRGGSSRPLYVTVAGIPLDEAKRHILSMTGQYRIPDILKTVDRLSRDK